MMRKSHRRSAAGLPALLVVIALQLACGGAGSGVEVGRPLPAFSLPSLEGTPLGSTELVGQPTVLTFWATWCQPCLKEIPLLRELDADPRLRLISVALDEGGAEVVRPFVAERSIDYPVLIGDQETFTRLGGLAIPHTLLIDSEGIVRDVVRGQIVGHDIAARLDLPAVEPGEL
ncbi:MAG: TlpA disulfide reductase family protein [Acidobacteriota bacterium]